MALAEDLEGVPLATGLLDATGSLGVETAEEPEQTPERSGDGRRAGSMRITPIEHQAPYGSIHKRS